MKFATKYMVVPFTQTGGVMNIENPEEAQINKLDQDMSNILAQKISLDEKLKLYTQTLARFASVYQPNTYSLPNVLAEMSTKASANEQKINEKLDQIEVKLEKKSLKTAPETEPIPEPKKRKITEELLPEDLAKLVTKRVSKRVSKQTEPFQMPVDPLKTKQKAKRTGDKIHKSAVTGEISDLKITKKLTNFLKKKTPVASVIKAKPLHPISEFARDTPLNTGENDFQEFEFQDFAHYVS